MTRIVDDTSSSKQQRITFDINENLSTSLATSSIYSSKLKPKEEKIPVGSLFTATSLDNSNNFFEIPLIIKCTIATDNKGVLYE